MLVNLRLCKEGVHIKTVYGGDYCKKSRHIRDKCWKLHKKPQNEQREKSNKAFQGTTGEETKGATAEEKLNSASMLEKSPFTKEQLGLLYKLFREYKLASSSCAFA